MVGFFVCCFGINEGAVLTSALFTKRPKPDSFNRSWITQDVKRKQKGLRRLLKPRCVGSLACRWILLAVKTSVAPVLWTSGPGRQVRGNAGLSVPVGYDRSPSAVSCFSPSHDSPRCQAPVRNALAGVMSNTALACVIVNNCIKR